jgi:hypothetical protein
MRIIACIEDAEVIEQILTHLESKAADSKPDGGRHTVRRPSADCSIDRHDPTTTLRGCGV